MSADMSRGADGHTVVDDTWNHLDMTTEFEIYDPPTDGISALQFSRWDTHRLLATSWDSSVYIYDCSGNVAVNKFSVGAALLDGCFSARDRNIAYAAGLGRQIHRYKRVLAERARLTSVFCAGVVACQSSHMAHVDWI